MFKEALYTTLGGALLIKDRVEEELKRLEDQGKLAKSDGEAFLERLKSHGEAEEERLKLKLKEALKEVIDELGLATKADIEALKSELK